MNPLYLLTLKLVCVALIIFFHVYGIVLDTTFPYFSLFSNFLYKVQCMQISSFVMLPVQFPVHY